MPHAAAGSRLGPLLGCASPALASPCRHPVPAPPESSTLAHLLTFTRLSPEDKELPPARAPLCTGNCGPVDPSSLETGFLPCLELPGWEAVNTAECACCWLRCQPVSESVLANSALWRCEPGIPRSHAVTQPSCSRHLQLPCQAWTAGLLRAQVNGRPGRNAFGEDSRAIIKVICLQMHFKK